MYLISIYLPPPPSPFLLKTEGLPWQSSGLRLGVSTAGGVGLIPHGGARIPHAEWQVNKKSAKKKKGKLATIYVVFILFLSDSAGLDCWTDDQV